jgi:hypothetical protein
MRVSTSMKTNPSLVKQKLPLGKGDAWIEVTSSHFAFVDFRAHPDGIECLRVPTGTNYEKQPSLGPHLRQARSGVPAHVSW